MTVRDIAATVGVRKSTVSRILNRHLDLGTHSPKKWAIVRIKKKTHRIDKILLQNTKITLSRCQCLQRHLLVTGVNTDS